jgi:glucan phosphorylase
MKTTPSKTLLVKFVTLRELSGAPRQETAEFVKTRSISRTLRSIKRASRKAARRAGARTGRPINYVQVYEVVQSKRLAEYKISR